MSHRSNTYYLLSLGCSKNTVDSQSMGQLLNNAGILGTGDPTDAEVLIVNTCGFIEDARQESIDALNDLLVVGHYTDKRGWVDDAVYATAIDGGHDYTLGVALKGSTVSVTLDGQTLLGSLAGGPTPA